MGKVVALAIFSMLGSGPSASAADPPDIAKLLQQAEETLAKVESYTTVFHKQERVNDKLLPQENIQLKFKRPFKVYMKWLKGTSAGQETLYVQGWNDNKLKGHGAGLLGLVTVDLDPTGSLAMKGNRHPITESGLESLVKKIGANLRTGVAAGDFTAKDLGEETVYGRKTTKVEGAFPKDPAKSYYCYRCVVNLDLEKKVPIRVEIFDFKDQLVEAYGFEDLRLDAGLTDKDFSPSNKDYHF
jgi:outer membrane lipoprotein-sorting protein